MQPIKTDLLTEVAEYYSAKLIEHGQTARGVDWNGEEGQSLRFKQLGKIIVNEKPFSINDLGCGYGALYDYLSTSKKEFTYTGFDVSEGMINAARQRYKANTGVSFIHSGEPVTISDYGVASGIFSVRLGRTDAEWRTYLEATLDILDKTSRIGFAFNCLTDYSDQEKKRDYLYYADPCSLFDFCKRRYSRNVALLHDYGLYEFTMLVRK